MFRALLAVLASALLAACATDSNWMLFDRGYSFDVTPYGEEVTVRVHLNQLKQLGGDVKSTEFRRFVSESLKDHGVCPGGWEEQLCADEAACIRRTAYSVTVLGHCVPQ